MTQKLFKSFICASLLLIGGLIQAQTVSGTVTEESTLPLPGVNVIVKGTTNGTQTDFDGKYTLTNVPSNAVIVFSYVGFKTQEVAVGNRSTINVALVEDASALDEVVIIGYGSTTVRDATGSVTAVTAEDFNSGVIASPEQLIQGKTAGVNIQQTSGEPGAGIQINIRGTSSVRANNNPLFVIDGIPLSGENIEPAGDAGNGATAPRNPLNFINPNDIESMSILKDASATAIYGSRGANGVVIITTKSGKAGSGGVFDFSSSFSYSETANEYDLLNRDQFLLGIAQTGGNPALVDFGADTDWQNEITRNVGSTVNNLAYSNNYGDGNVRATFGYSKQYGVVEKTDLERITGRINANHRFLDDKLKVSLNATYSRLNNETAPLSASADFRGDILGAAYSANPTWPADPTFNDGGTQIKPANFLANTQNITNTNRFLINGSATYDINDNFSAKVNLGFDKSDGEAVGVSSSNIFGQDGISNIGAGVFNTLERESKLIETTLNWNKEFSNSSIDALVGFSFQDFRTFGRNVAARGIGATDLNRMGDQIRNSAAQAEAAIAGTGSFQQYYYAANTNGLQVNRLFPNSTTDNIGFIPTSGVNALVADTFDNTDELQSFFTRVNYTIANKYLFTATVRADGSSRFGSDNQYGYFPSGAFAWKAHEEDFIGDAFSTLKLRVSAGEVGNQDGLGYGNFANRQRFAELNLGSINSGQEVQPNGLISVSFPRTDLKWETTLNLNFGIDFGLNNDRFNGSLDFYRRDTRDLLFSLPPAFPSTQAFQFRNIDANLINQGVELALNYDWVTSNDFNFSTSFNVAYNENEIQNFAGAVNFAEINGPGLSGAFAQRFEEGRSMYSYYMAIFEGFDSSGNPIYADIDGNGVGDPDADKTFVGEDGLPDVTTGLALNANYKNWDLSAFFTGQFGFSVYNNTENAFFVKGSLNNARNVTQEVFNSNEDPGSSIAVSTRFLERGDFVRFQNFTLGYNFNLEEDSFFKSLRLSVTGQNLFLITDYSGLDPEVTVQTGNLGSGIPGRSIDWAAFPNPRTFTFGLNARF
mgnify:CR=1 FL=1